MPDLSKYLLTPEIRGTGRDSIGSKLKNKFNYRWQWEIQRGKGQKLVSYTMIGVAGARLIEKLEVDFRGDVYYEAGMEGVGYGRIKTSRIEAQHLAEGMLERDIRRILAIIEKKKKGRKRK